MTVKELKEILSKLDDDLEVKIGLFNDTSEDDNNVWFFPTREISVRPHPYTTYKLRRWKDGKVAQRACKETAGAIKCLVI